MRNVTRASAPGRASLHAFGGGYFSGQKLFCCNLSIPGQKLEPLLQQFETIAAGNFSQYVYGFENGKMLLRRGPDLEGQPKRIFATNLRTQ